MKRNLILSVILMILTNCIAHAELMDDICAKNISDDMCMQIKEQQKQFADSLNPEAEKLKKELELKPNNTKNLARLGNIYVTQKKYTEAENLFLRYLALREEKKGKDNFEITDDLKQLGIFYVNQKKYEQAEPYMQRIIAIREKQLGKDYEGIDSDLISLATIYKLQSKYDQAESLYVRSLDIVEGIIDKKLLKETKPDFGYAIFIGTLSDSLGEIYSVQNKYQEAKSLYERVINIFEKAYSKDSTYITNPLDKLAIIYQTQGKYKEAESLLQRSLAITENFYGTLKLLNAPAYLVVSTSLNNLADIYVIESKYTEAEPLYKKSLDILEKALNELENNAHKHGMTSSSYEKPIKEQYEKTKKITNNC